MYVNQTGSSAAMISLDQEKAFDSVDCGFLQRTLETMGFGQSFCCWVRTFYANPQASVQINGFLSPFLISLRVSSEEALCHLYSSFYVLKF